MLSGLFYAEATRCSLESLPAGYGNPRSLRTRKLRWERDGTLRRLMQAGEPVIQRMHGIYWGLIRDASINWDNSREILGPRRDAAKHRTLQPQGPLCRRSAPVRRTKFMADNTERQFREADAVIDRSVAAFIIKIESMSGKWDAVSRQYIVEGVLLKLCDEMTKLIDKPALARHHGDRR